MNETKVWIVFNFDRRVGFIGKNDPGLQWQNWVDDEEKDDMNFGEWLVERLDYRRVEIEYTE